MNLHRPREKQRWFVPVIKYKMEYRSIYKHNNIISMSGLISKVQDLILVAN